MTTKRTPAKRKYPWDNAPVWAKWASTDKDGRECWFSHKPLCLPEWQAWMRDDAVPGCGKFSDIEGSVRKPCRDWSNSLQAKPKPTPAKRAKIEWGIWIPRASKNDCRVLLLAAERKGTPLFDHAQVRRLPRGLA